MRDASSLFWARTALRFLLRSGRSTAALSLMVVVAVSALIFLSALAVGVNDAMLQNTVGVFSGHITGRNLPASITPSDLMVDGVSGVARRVYLSGTLSNEHHEQYISLCAVVPEVELEMTAFEKKTILGRYPESGRMEIFISHVLAGDLVVSAGDTLQFLPSASGVPLSFTVSGIYETGNDRLDRKIAFCPQSAVPETDGTWWAAVFLSRGVSPKKIIEGYEKRWPDVDGFTSWERMMPDLRQLIDLQYFSMGIVIFLVFGVVSVGIACIFVIFIIRSLREYGIMKAMGTTTREISLLIVMKVGLMNLVSCSAGIVIGVFAVWAVAASGGIDISSFTSHNRYFSVSGIILPRLTLFSLVVPPLTAFVFGLLAAIWPAALVARKKAADIIRMI